MSEYTELWLKAFLWTVALETPVYLLFLRRSFEAFWAPLLISLLAQLTTHPALWFVVPELMPQFEPYWLWVLICELGVTTVEIGVVFVALRGRPTRGKALGLAAITSIAANVFSTLVGLFLL